MHARALELVESLLEQACADPRPQDHGVERLREVVVGTDLDAADDAVRLVDGGDHDHGDVTRRGRRLQTFEDGDPVELGHHDVEQHDVDLLLREQRQGLGAVRRRAHRVPFLLQETAQQLAADGVVVGDEDRCGHCVQSILAASCDVVNRSRSTRPGSTDLGGPNPRR